MDGLRGAIFPSPSGEVWAECSVCFELFYVRTFQRKGGTAECGSDLLKERAE